MFRCFFFFFSSRRRHTRCSRDWSSDVCSSDLTWREHDGLAGTQDTRSGELAHPDARPLQVHEDRHRDIGGGGGLPHRGDPRGALLRGPVGRVHTNDVRAGADQLGDALGRPRGGTERGDDLSAADQSRSLLPSRSSLFNIPGAWSSCGKLNYWGPPTPGQKADDEILEADGVSEYRAVE